MTNIIDIRNAIYKWLHDETGIEIIRANQNAVEPKEQFCTYQVTNVDSVGHDERQYIYHPSDEPLADGMTEVIDGMRLIMVSINVFRGNSYDVVSRIAASLEKSYTNDALWLSGLNFVRRSEIRDLTQIMHAQYESRHQIDVFFYVGSRYESPVDILETVNITRDYY